MLKRMLMNLLYHLLIQHENSFVGALQLEIKELILYAGSDANISKLCVNNICKKLRTLHLS